MQNDLISRSALLECFSITKNGHRIPERDCDNFEITVSIKDIKKIIKNQPIAYDVGKVVTELEEYEYSHLIEHNSEQSKHCAEHGECDGEDCFLCLWIKAKAIVRNGGKV